MSMTAQGVPYSRAILAARGVVINSLRFSVGVIARSEATKQSSFAAGIAMDCFASLAMTAIKASSLFDLFAQLLELQPSVFCLLQFLLRFGKRI